MKILVTGGAGFIGSNFIRYYLNKYPKRSIVNLDKLTYAGNLNNLKDIENNPYYKFVKGDIGNINILDQILPSVDTVLNFAAESHVDNSITGPKVFIETNVLGTQVLLDACVQHKITRFHHISTDEVFGDLELDSKDKFNENTNYNPHSPYSASKASSDHLVRAYGTTYGLKYTITNCSNNYGQYQHPEKLIPKFITNLLLDKKVPVYGEGKNIRDWLYVLDHCEAVDLTLEKGLIGETYCIGGQTEEINNLELTKLIIKICGKDESYIEYAQDRKGHDKKYSVDWSKAKNKLGYNPKHNFEENIIKTVDWYKKNEWWWRVLIK